MEKITFKELSKILDRHCFDSESLYFDTEEAIRFLWKLGLLNLDRIEGPRRKALKEPETLEIG